MSGRVLLHAVTASVIAVSLRQAHARFAKPHRYSSKLFDYPLVLSFATQSRLQRCEHSLSYSCCLSVCLSDDRPIIQSCTRGDRRRNCRSDRRGDSCCDSCPKLNLFNRATNWRSSPRRSPRRSFRPVAATIAPCKSSHINLT